MLLLRRMLIVTPLLLVGVHLLLRFLPAFGVPPADAMVHWFHLDEEYNIPSLYSALLLALAAGWAAWIGRLERDAGAHCWKHWMSFGMVFAYLAVDEATAIHEKTMEPLRRLFGVSGGVLFYSWVILAVPILLLLAISFWRWFWFLPVALRRRAIGAGILFLGGALGMELPGGLLGAQGQQASDLYFAITTLEESLELAGMTLWVLALLEYAQARNARPTLAVKSQYVPA